MRDPFPRVRQHEEGVLVECDKELMEDLVEVLEHVLCLAKAMKMKARAIRAEQQILIEKAKAQAAISYRQMSDQVRQAYDDALADGCCKKGALRLVMDNFKLKAVDARGYVSAGRKFRKQELKIAA